MEDWKLQVSYKSSDGGLINVRAGSGAELSLLLGDIGELATQITSVGATLGGVATLAPLSTSSFTDTPAQATYSAPATPAGGTAPTCMHGPRKFLSGVSKKNGKAYAMWVCQQPQGSQCEVVN